MVLLQLLHRHLAVKLEGIGIAQLLTTLVRWCGSVQPRGLCEVWFDRPEGRLTGGHCMKGASQRIGAICLLGFGLWAASAQRAEATPTLRFVIDGVVTDCADGAACDTL